MRETRQLAKIARLYYLEGLPQRDIAKRFNISIASISRALTRARELGIVSIEIKSDDEGFQAQESAIEMHYGLDECVLTRSHESLENSYVAMAEALSDLLPRLLPRSGVLGVSWGETLRAVARQLKPATNLVADAIPIIGAMGTVETGIYPNNLAGVFADKLGGRAYLLNAPAVYDSPDLARQMMESSTFDSVRETWNRVDVALVGTSGINEDTSMARQGIVAEAELAALAEAGAASAVNFSFFDDMGKPIDHEIGRRILNMPLETLKRVPHVVLVAGGFVKISAIRSALRSGVISVLVTDIETARAL